ncbi:hypothetical protein OQA88_34 [Cercophora sp. LCS_1]
MNVAELNNQEDPITLKVAMAYIVPLSTLLLVVFGAAFFHGEVRDFIDARINDHGRAESGDDGGGKRKKKQKKRKQEPEPEETSEDSDEGEDNAFDDLEEPEQPMATKIRTTIRGIGEWCVRRRSQPEREGSLA